MNETNETMNVTAGKKVQTRDDARMRVKKIAFIGLMGAVSAVLMLFRFPIPFMPPFLSFDFSGLMEMLGGFMFGPMAAVCIIIVKIMLQLVMQGSFSLGTGELQNLILSCAYVLPALIIYHRSKSKKMAVAGMAVSSVFVAVVAVFTNLYLIIPFYVKLFGMSMDDIIAMCSTVNPAMKNAVTMALFGILPFNLIKYGVTSLITFIIYKRLSKVIKGIISR
ncbi:riboflavin transporter [Lachnospiraceae bacterium]|uniref:ECF transporter S component n=1 Tax=Extibacter sp. GGCC_0201 TaxID=2731209 RepID=UPI001AA1B6AE|nr:ECF transporter S component [Extibacter sp. GGCC_0201]MBO1722318.1 ECF transporter S component [Extibacter sp. GGCC_0201]BDF32883.1 riboflavin transporter [Lachnospiraceae bacterium]BDF36888.1 riboflavin transporter [Lachnospiraceae bacterium]